MQSVPLQLVHTQVAGKRVTFCVNMERDPVQRNHRKGTFYELKALAALRNVFPDNGVFVDIGANVGNHSLYAALFLNARRVIPFEPNPRAYDLLIQNVLVNRLETVFDLSNLGVGVSDEPMSGFAMEERDRNLGAARMLPGEGSLSVVKGDEVLSGESPDFIKIDVEGMEMRVLSGLEQTLQRCSPVLLIEVDNTVEDAFFDWADAQGYGLVFTHQRYKTNKNHVIAPKDRLPALRSHFVGTGMETKAR